MRRFTAGLRLVAAVLFLLAHDGAAAQQLGGDTLIVPGRRIGPLSLGASLTEAALLLGDRDVRGRYALWRESHLGIRRGFGVGWPSRGIVVVICQATDAVRLNEIVALVLLGYEEASDSRRFATAGGVRIGSTRSDIDRTFGPATGTWVNLFDQQRLWFDRSGVFFDFDEDGTVFALGVYRPFLCGEGHD